MGASRKPKAERRKPVPKFSTACLLSGTIVPLLSPQPRTYHRHLRMKEDVVGRLLVIDVVGAFGVLGAWYFLFAAYNRRKGTEALRWVQSACAGKGRILDSRWSKNSRLLDARLQFPSRSFENAHVTMEFRPRAWPLEKQFASGRCNHALSQARGRRAVVSDARVHARLFPARQAIPPRSRRSE